MNNETKFSFDPENKIVTNNETGSRFNVKESNTGWINMTLEPEISLEDRPVVSVNGIFY